VTVEFAPPFVHGRAIVINIGAVLALLALAALSLEPLFGTMAAAAFLALGTLLIISQPMHSIGSLLRWWPLLLLPAYCLLSILWSQFPDNTSRYGMQLTFTLAVAIVIASRVPAATLLRGLFLIYAAGVVLSVGIGRSSDGSGAWLGIFGSKNAFAAFVAVFAVISAGLLFDRASPRWLRLMALAGALLSLPLLIRAQSAGALAVIGPAVLTVILVNSSRLLSDMQKTFLVGFAVVTVLAGALIFATYGDQLMAAFLETSGKDSTLTGRTDLWRTGYSLIAERPFLGVGYRAFWVSGYGPAEQLWAMFGEQSGAGFNFHNTYISNAVELGFVGLAIEVAIIYVAAALLIVLAVVRPTHIIAFLLGLQVLLILRSFVEVEVFYEFSVRSMLTYCTFVYAVREVRNWRAETRPTMVVSWRPREA
jgi:exopolysaccharide production protein ExoQ